MKDNYKSRIMKNLFNYWFKTNKKSLYDQLGKEFNVSGFRVYKLDGHHTSCIFGLTPSGRWG